MLLFEIYIWQVVGVSNRIHKRACCYIIILNGKTLPMSYYVIHQDIYWDLHQ